MEPNDEESSDLSIQCSKCPILIKEVGVIRDLQSKLLERFNKVEEMFVRFENIEKNVDGIMEILVNRSQG
jgi:hypothetical protein